MLPGTVPDLLRLLAVPVLAWGAWRDVRVRRVPNALWLPLAGLGVALLGWELLAHVPVAGARDRLFLLRVALSIGVLVPLAYVFWRIGGFGGADAKAMMCLAVLLPTYPTYYLSTVALPLERTTLGVFSLTVLTNTVLVGLAYPLALAVRNAVAGETGPAMFLARRVPVGSLPDRHGRLFEDRDGDISRGLDLDALRMYLRWRGVSLADVRAAPDVHRDPASVGDTRDPGDGAVDLAPDGGRADDGRADDASERSSAEPAGAPNADDWDGRGERNGRGDRDDGAPDDPWAAARFLDGIEGDAYGTTPETLREGLETVTTRDRVWVSPGIPFLVPTFVGLVVAFTYGDLLFTLLTAVGAV